MRPAAHHLLLVLLMLAVFGGACKRADKQQQTPGEVKSSQSGQCPKLEGSYLGTDSNTIMKGEAARLSWKILREYAATSRIEGLPHQEPQPISSFNNDGTTHFYEASLENVRPSKTTTFILKATGPDGCQPLELSTSVKVIDDAGETKE